MCALAYCCERGGWLVALEYLQLSNRASVSPGALLWHDGRAFTTPAIEGRNMGPRISETKGPALVRGDVYAAIRRASRSLTRFYNLVGAADPTRSENVNTKNSSTSSRSPAGT